MAAGNIQQLKILFERATETHTALGKAWFFPEPGPDLTAEQAQQILRQKAGAYSQSMLRYIESSAELARIQVEVNIATICTADAGARGLWMASLEQVGEFVEQGGKYLISMDDTTLAMCGFGPEVDYGGQYAAKEKLQRVLDDLRRMNRWHRRAFQDADDELDFHLTVSGMARGVVPSLLTVAEKARVAGIKVADRADEVVRRAADVMNFLSGSYIRSGARPVEVVRCWREDIFRYSGRIGSDSRDMVERELKRVSGGRSAGPGIS